MLSQDIGAASEDLLVNGDSISFDTVLGDIFFPSVEEQLFTTYGGSLTTPGCFEIVTWINWQEPLYVREDFVSSCIVMYANKQIEM